MDAEAQDIHFREQGWLLLPGFLARQAVAPLGAPVPLAPPAPPPSC